MGANATVGDNEAHDNTRQVCQDQREMGDGPPAHSLVTSLYLPNTWGGKTLTEYHTMLREGSLTGGNDNVSKSCGGGQPSRPANSVGMLAGKRQWKESWSIGLSLKRRRPETIEDEVGFCRSVVSNLNGIRIPSVE